jgi:nucleoside-diphosphate-sugar epimerase
MSWTLVTGGTGFLGRHLVATLRARGHEVRVLSRHAASPDARAPIESLGAHVVPGDLLDRASVRMAVAGVACVFHLAGRLLEPGVGDGDYERLHVEGTRNLLDACLDQSHLQAVVHCSTTGVLGPTGAVLAGEDAPSRPSNVYERTKAQAEALALLSARHDGLPLCVVRPALVYGPGDRHLLGWFRAIKAGLYHVIGRGDNLLHPVYVTDVAEGIARSAELPVTRGRVYHFVGERPVAIGELSAAIARALHRSLPRTHLPRALAYATASILERLPGIEPTRLPLTRSRVEFMTESRAYTGARAAADLGFVPSVDLGSGLARTVDWYRGAGLL